MSCLTRIPISKNKWKCHGCSRIPWLVTEQNCLCKGAVLRFGPSFTFSHTYLPSDSLLSWLCTCILCLSSFWLTSLTTVYFLSRSLHFDSWQPRSQKRIYRPRYSLYKPNLALFKYTWVPGQVHSSNLSLWYLKSPWDIPFVLRHIVRDLVKSLVAIVLTVSQVET